MTLAVSVGQRLRKRALLAVPLLVLSVGATDDIGQSPESAFAAGDDPRSAAALSLADRITACQRDPRVVLGLVTNEVCVGADLFFNEPFNGNGRTCGTCHPPSNNFTIDVPFINSLSAANRASLLATTVPGLERPALLQQFGLILENVDGLEAPTTKFVMRSVPHTFSLGRSIAPVVGNGDLTETPPRPPTLPFPAQRTGWGGDGAPSSGGLGVGALRDFQTGAIIQHYTKRLNRVAGTDFRLATSDELDRILAFMGTIGRTNELTLTAVHLTDADAETGRGIFLTAGARCDGCHGNAGANAGGVNRNFNTGVETVRIPALDQAPNAPIPRDGGFGVTQVNANGSFGNGSFSTPPLIEAADTGPFFHTNAFNTIEDAIRFYTTPAFANSPAGLAGGAIVLNATQIANLGRFLRALNVAFNCQLAMARLQAAITIMNSQSTSRAVEDELLRLADAEMEDAIQVLQPFPLFYVQGRIQLTTARGLLQGALNAPLAPLRVQFAQQILNLVASTNTTLGTGLTMTMGPGTLMGSLPLPSPVASQSN